MLDCVILAGGFGTRLRAISGDTPKPMMNVGGIPLIYRLMHRLEAQGCENIFLSLHYGADQIISKIQQDKPVKCNVHFCVEETPLGTGGALKNAAKFMSTSQIVALNGDSVFAFDLNTLLRDTEKYSMVMYGVWVDNVERYGRLAIDKCDHLIKMEEKGCSGPGFINAGCYVLGANELLEYPDDKFSLERDFINSRKGSIKVVGTKERFIDIGIPEDYEIACRMFK